MADLVRVGGILRAERKKTGKSIEWMAEELALGTTTISSIERGLPTVSIEKYQYYAEKLGKGMLFGLVGEAEQKILALREQLQDIEEILLANPEKAMDDLKRLNKTEKIGSIPILQPFIYYLKGKYYLSQKEWKLTEDFFSQAILIAENQSELEMANLATGSYLELGIAFYYQDRFHEALTCTEKGLESYIHEGDRSFYYALLLLNKSIYLERLNLLEKALLCIEQLEKYIRENHSMESEVRKSVIIQMYTLYATILNKLRMNERGLMYAKKGIQLALTNRSYDHLFRLWAQTGIIYESLGELESAERYYLKALDLEPSLTDNEHLFPFAFVHFAKLLVKKQQWQKAKQLLERSIKICRKIKDNWLLVQSLLVFGEWYMQQEQHNQAVILLQEAEEIAMKYAFDELINKSISSLCTCYEAVRDETSFLKYAVKLYHLQKGGN